MTVNIKMLLGISYLFLFFACPCFSQLVLIACLPGGSSWFCSLASLLPSFLVAQAQSWLAEGSA